MSEIHPNHQTVVDALRADPEPLIEWAAGFMIMLAAKSEWDMDDNFATTESLAALTQHYDLPAPAANYEVNDGARFWGAAAVSLRLPADVEEWSCDDETREVGLMPIIHATAVITFDYDTEDGFVTNPEDAVEDFHDIFESLSAHQFDVHAEEVIP